MKKLVKWMACGICCVVAALGCGCDFLSQFLGGNQSGEKEMDEIFKGNYTKVTLSKIEEFATHTRSTTFEELMDGDKGLNCSVNLTREFANGTIQKEWTDATVLKKNNVYQYTITGMLQKGMNGGEISEYCDGENAYVSVRENGSTEEKWVVDANRRSWMTTTGLRGPFSLTDVIDEVKEADGEVHEIDGGLSGYQVYSSSFQYYMDTTDANYTKIKIDVKVEGESPEGEIEMELFFAMVYTKDYQLVAEYTNALYSMPEEKRKQVISITPFSGALTPPNDLDTYLPRE